MPKIKIDHIVSFSSEDPVHIANNILSPDTNKKWKCKETGEKSATVVLQLEKAHLITGIDIGNENSAYIEILVTRTGLEDDYKVFLVMSSLMTPLEARQSTNVNKVRMFNGEHFCVPECEQKWDRIKIVCTQPFNRHVQYGLSFITFHSSEDKPTTQPIQTIGRFVVREPSPDDIKPGSLFAKHRQNKQKEENKRPVVPIREAMNSPKTTECKPQLLDNATPGRSTDKATNIKIGSRNRNELLYKKDEEDPNEKIDEIIQKKTKEKTENKHDELIEKKIKKKNEPKENNKRKNDKPSNTPNKKPKLEKKTKPFNQLLNGVTLVISGIQNPDRANLRSMALSLGAKYKPDWDNNCTHLICAFPNTPKFNQVQGKGKIVTRKWLEDCHSQRKRLPWRRYALDKNDKTKDESEDEVLEEVEDEDEVRGEVEVEDEDSGVEGYDDTELQEKIEEIQNKKDIYLDDTDEEILEKNVKNDIPNELPEYFKDKIFFIDKDIDEEMQELLERYIIPYSGIIHKKPEHIDYYITPTKVNCEAICVNPDWIWECHNEQKLISIDQYIL